MRDLKKISISKKFPDIFDSGTSIFWSIRTKLKHHKRDVVFITSSGIFGSSSSFNFKPGVVPNFKI